MDNSLKKLNPPEAWEVKKPRRSQVRSGGPPTFSVASIDIHLSAALCPTDETVKFVDVGVPLTTVDRVYGPGEPVVRCTG